MTKMLMGIGNLFPIKEREQISSGTVQNASNRKEKMCAYLTSITKVKASKEDAKLLMPNDENTKKLNRGTKMNETGSKYTAKQEI